MGQKCDTSRTLHYIVREVSLFWPTLYIDVYFTYLLFLLLRCVYQHTKFEVPIYLHRFQRYDWDKITKTGHVTLTTPILMVLCHGYAGAST